VQHGCCAGVLARGSAAPRSKKSNGGMSETLADPKNYRNEGDEVP